MSYNHRSASSSKPLHQHKRHLLAHSASSGQLSSSIDTPLSDSAKTPGLTSQLNSSSYFSQFALTNSTFPTLSHASSESSALLNNAHAGSPEKSSIVLSSPIKGDNYTSTSARLRRPSMGLMSASNSAGGAVGLGNPKVDSSSISNLSPRNFGSLSTRSSPRNSFSNYSPYFSTPASANSSSQQMIIDTKPSFSSSRLSSGEIIDLMEKEQDAIVLKLMREINYLKEENKLLRAHVNNSSFDGSRSSSRRASKISRDDEDSARVSRRRTSSQKFGGSPSSFENYKLDTSFVPNSQEAMRKLNAADNSEKTGTFPITTPQIANKSFKVLKPSQTANSLASKQVPRVGSSFSDPKQSNTTVHRVASPSLQTGEPLQQDLRSQYNYH